MKNKNFKDFSLKGNQMGDIFIIITENIESPRIPGQSVESRRGSFFCYVGACPHPHPSSKLRYIGLDNYIQDIDITDVWSTRNTRKGLSENGYPVRCSFIILKRMDNLSKLLREGVIDQHKFDHFKNIFSGKQTIEKEVFNLHVEILQQITKIPHNNGLKQFKKDFRKMARTLKG